MKYIITKEQLDEVIDLLRKSHTYKARIILNNLDVLMEDETNKGS